MKRSTLFIAHMMYWALLASIQLVNVIASRYSTPQLGEFSRYSIYVYPIAFYTGYLLTFPVSKSREWRFFAIGIFISFLMISIFLLRQGAGVGLLLYYCVTTCISGGLFRLAIDWYNKKAESARLQKQNLKSELDLLRFQINPHFLFNTLNNIDTLIMKDQQKASKSLIKVSDIMRYMLHDSTAEKVNLGKEISYLKDYVDLEKLRLQHPEFVSFECTGKPDDMEVSPMLFIPFIENAFKHSPLMEEDQRISVSFNIQPGKLEFSCRNSVDTASVERDTSSGIGLTTVKRRLKLLYPGKFELHEEQINGIHAVHLALVTA